MATLLSEKQLLVLLRKLPVNNTFCRELSLDHRRDIDKIVGLKLDKYTAPDFDNEDDCPIERIVFRILREGAPNSSPIERDCYVVLYMNANDGEGTAIVVDPKFVQAKDSILSVTETSSAAYKAAGAIGDTVHPKYGTS